jgi:hypothetical protein
MMIDSGRRWYHVIKALSPSDILGAAQQHTIKGFMAVK